MNLHRIENKSLLVFYKNYCTILVVFIFLLLYNLETKGQSSILFSSDNQLSSSLINQVYQDSKGIIWIPTENGLNRYDGAKFVQYKHDENNLSSILSNYVKHVFESSKGQLFFGFLNGLQLYDQDSHEFHKIPMLFKSGEEAHPHVSSIIERHDGSLIAATYNGIFQINKKGNSFQANKIYNITDSYLIKQLYEDHQNNLWILTTDQGITRIEPNKNKTTYLKDISNSGNFSKITEDKSGNILLGCLKGLYQFESQKKTFKRLNFSNSKQDLPIIDLYVNNDNEILVGTENYGLKIFCLKENTLYEINPNHRKFDFSKSKVHSVIQDRTGNLWAGIYQRGVMLIPPKSNNFHYIGYQSLHNSISSTFISALYKDHKNILWVGTDGDGLFGINPDGSLLMHLKQGPKAIMSIYEDSQNRLWVGTYLKGLCWLNRQNNKFHYYNDTHPNNTNPEHVLSIIEDSKKDLWIGSLGSGLYRLNHNNGLLEPMNYFNKNNKLHNYWINCLIPNQEKIFIGTYYGLTSYTEEKGYSDYLPENPVYETKVIYSLFKDSKENIWIGTSEGLYCLPKNKKEFIKYDEKNGLCNNIICAILEDPKGNLWISTQHGLSQFNPENKRFINFYSSDGLQGNEFNRGSSFYSKEGFMYFGGINGITYFNPLQITNGGKTSDIKITSLYLRNKEVTRNQKSGSYSILNGYINEMDTVELSASDNTFTIEMATTNFIDPQRIRYYYSLNNQEWLNLPLGSNNINFNNLQAGEYTLKIKAKEYNIFSPEKTIKIIIHPQWYATIWAKLSYCLVSVLGVFFLFYQLKQHYKTKEKIQIEQQKSKITEAKEEFFINISHDIKTPISLISNPLKKLITTDSDIIRQENYRLMKRNLDKIHQLINQLMDVRKIDKGLLKMQLKKTELVSLLKEISLLFEDERLNKKIYFDFHYEEEEIFAMVDSKYFDKIIQNILSNAYKFTPVGGHINLYLKEIKQNSDLPHIQIIIQDNGKGIPENDKERIFERFYQVVDNTNEEGGTGIGLHFTKSIVQLHNGTIGCQNNANKNGCHFIIEIPQGVFVEDSQTIIVQPKLPDETTQITEGLIESGKKYTKSKYRLLIVDDDKDIREYLEKELEILYHVKICKNGKEGITYVLQHLPDLIISDIKMPEMDGITLCRKIKQNINVNFIPIILLTAKTDEKDNIEGLNIGADAYIQKPFNLDILKNTIQNIIRNRNLLKNSFSGKQFQEERLDSLELTSSDEKLIKKITDYVTRNMDNPELNIEMITNEIGISRVHLYRKLKELTNQSARDFIKNIRLKQAGVLLANKKLNIQEVCYAVGYTNVSLFSTNFKEFYGISPKFYGEEHLKNKEKSF